MSAKRSPKPGGQEAGLQGEGMPKPKRVRKIPRLKEPVDMTVLLKSVVWVVGLLLVRYEKNVPGAANLAHLAVQTVREYVRMDHPGAWFTAGVLAQALGLYPDYLEKLARRWLAKYRHRETAKHAHEKGWELKFPWELPPPEVKHD